MEVADVYPNWQSRVQYKKGDMVKYDSLLYRVEQDHTSQAHQPPNSECMLAIYRPLQEETPGKIPTWIYGEKVEIGDKRIDPNDGQVYECYAEAGVNIWPPHEVPAIWRLVENSD